MILPPPRSTLFPYTTLFRSETHCLVSTLARAPATCRRVAGGLGRAGGGTSRSSPSGAGWSSRNGKRSEEHTSELQSLRHLVCRLLLEKKKTKKSTKYKTNEH